MKRLILFAILGLCAASGVLGQDGQFNRLVVRNGMKVGGFLRIPTDTIANADTFSIAIKNGKMYHKDVDMKWKLVSADGGGSGSIDTTYQLVFSGATFDRFLVYAFTDSVAGFHYYNDSIALKGGPPMRDKVFAMRLIAGVDSAGWYYPGLQWALDGDNILTRRNKIVGNSAAHMLDLDSIGLRISQKYRLTGGRDTVIAGYGGGSHLFSVTQSGGLKVNSIVSVGNVADLAMINGYGLYVRNHIIEMSLNSQIRGNQWPIILRRTYPGVGQYQNMGTIITNDTSKGLYPFPGPSVYQPLVIRYVTEAGDTTQVMRVYADGKLFIRSVPVATTQSSATRIVIYDPVDSVLKTRTLAEITSGGSGSFSLLTVGSTPNTYGASYNSGTGEFQLQPANGTYGGIVSTGSQTFAGAKNFNSNTTSFTPVSDGQTTLRVNAAAGTPIFQIGTFPSVPSFAGLWAGNITPSATNFWAQVNDQAIRLRAAGSDRIVMTSTGTGINTQTPETALDVNGTVKLRSVADFTLDSLLGQDNGNVVRESILTAVRRTIDAIETPVAATSATSMTMDYLTGKNIYFTSAHASITLSATNVPDGGIISVEFTNDADGGNTLILPGGATATVDPGANAVTFLVGRKRGSSWIWSTTYQTASGTTGGRETFTATASQTAFTTSGTLPASDYKIIVFRNGVEIDFTRSSNTITIPASTAGDQIKVRWYN